MMERTETREIYHHQLEGEVVIGGQTATVFHPISVAREVFEHGPLLLQTRSRPSKYMTILPVKGVAHLSGDEGMAVIIKRVAWYGTKRVT